MPEKIPSQVIDNVLHAAAARVIRGHIEHCLDSRGFNFTSWSLLTIVAAAKNGIRLSEVAASLGVKAPLVTMLADKLIGLGYIRRVPHHIDKRAKLLLITSAGKKLEHTIQKDIALHLAPLGRNINQKDLAIFHQVLQAIIANAP